jgi:hypothetical protein
MMFAGSQRARLDGKPVAEVESLDFGPWALGFELFGCDSISFTCPG